MSAINNSLYVEAVLNAAKVQPHEIEMALARQATKAWTGQPTARLWRRTLARLGHLLVAVSEQSSRATSAQN